MSRKQALLEHLLYAGERGLTSLELSQLVGHRFGARLAELRRAGHEIVSERVPGSGGGLCRYRLVLPPGTPPPPPGFTPERPPLSIRRAWPLLSKLLAEDTLPARAQVVDLLLHQPELATSGSVRHNLGERKRRLLDELAARVIAAE